MDAYTLLRKKFLVLSVSLYVCLANSIAAAVCDGYYGNPDNPRNYCCGFGIQTVEVNSLEQCITIAEPLLKYAVSSPKNLSCSVVRSGIDEPQSLLITWGETRNGYTMEYQNVWWSYNCYYQNGYYANTVYPGAQIFRYVNYDKIKLSLSFDDRISPTYRSTAKNAVEVIVTDHDNNPKPDVTVTLQVEALSYSGGHDHDNSSRPDGVLTYEGCTTCKSNSVSIKTDAAGRAKIIFIAPQVSGTHILIANCTPTCEFSGIDRFAVGIDGLVELQDNEEFDLIGSNDYHKRNHFVTPEVSYKLYDLALLYHLRFPNDPVLKYNDASLPTGGRFDLGRSWTSGSHKTHRIGRNIDVRANSHLNSDAIPHWNYFDFEDMVLQLGGKYLHELFATDQEHYHLEF